MQRTTDDFGLSTVYSPMQAAAARVKLVVSCRLARRYGGELRRRFLTLREAAKVLIEQGEGGSLVAVLHQRFTVLPATRPRHRQTGLNGLARAWSWALRAITYASTCSPADQTELVSGATKTNFRTVTTATRFGAGQTRASFGR